MFDFVWTDEWTLAASALAVVVAVGLAAAWAVQRRGSTAADDTAADADGARWHWPRWGSWRNH